MAQRTNGGHSLQCGRLLLIFDASFFFDWRQEGCELQVDFITLTDFGVSE